MAEAVLPLTKLRRVFDKGAHMMDLHHKRGEDELDYFIDLARWLEPDEAIISARAWVGDLLATLTGSVTIVPDPYQLTAFRADFAPTGVVVWLRGGNDGRRYVVSCLIQTDLGKIKLIRFAIITRGTGTLASLLLPIIRVTDITVNLVQAPITVAPPTFGLVAVGAEQISAVTITNNTGLDPLVVLSITGTGDFTPVGAYVTGLPRSIPLGGSGTFDVRFTPSVIGARNGLVTITTNALGGAVVLNVTGTGAPATNRILLEDGGGILLEDDSGFIVSED